MADLNLNLTIVPVGPRRQWQTPPNDEWLFALQVAASFSDEPASDAEKKDWAGGMLPWKLLGDQTQIELGWRLFRADNTSQVGGTAMAHALGALDPLDIRGTLATKFPEFGAMPNPQRVFAMPGTGVIGEVDQSKLLMPAVLQALGGATPELTSGEMRVTWYFGIHISNALIDEITHQIVRLAAWPLKFFDTRNNQSVEFDFQDNQFDLTNRAVQIPYRSQQTNQVALLAQTLPFPFERRKTPNEPALNDYWLPAFDSRLDSVAEIHMVITNGLKIRERVNFLTADLLVADGVKRDNSVDVAADARLLLDIARRLFNVNEDAPDQVKARETLASALIQQALHAAKLQQRQFLDMLRAELVTTANTWWTDEGLKSINARAIVEGVIKSEAEGWKAGTGNLLGDFGLFLVPAPTDVRPLLPGEGIDVLLGEGELRLRHEGDSADANNDTSNESDHAQIAELGVLVRRASTKDDLPLRQWFLATSAVAALDLGGELNGVDRYWGSKIDPPHGVTDESIPYHHAPLVRGVKCTFDHGLARTDQTYYGSPLIAETIGSALHGIPGQPSKDDPDFFHTLLPLSYQAVGPVLSNVQNGSFCQTPPLRYGDWYQFAGFVIDRGGGIPSELVTANARPVATNIDWTRLNAGNLSALDANERIEFLRRVAVGEINIVPPIDPNHPEKRPQWPVLPNDVVLRAREWLSSISTETENLPVLLLSDGAEFLRTLPTYVFHVSAPALDEHTLSRWLMPSAVDPADAVAVQNAKAQHEQLIAALADIHRKRDFLLGRRAALTPPSLTWEEEQDVLPPDPAVSKIGLRCTLVDRDGNSSLQRSFLDTPADVTVAIGNAASLVNPITLLPGTFAVLEFLPLVKAEDFERFEALAMNDLTEEEPWVDDNGVQYTAFHASRILVEAATAELPDATRLYDAFTLSPPLPNGAIELSLKTDNVPPLDNVMFVDRFELARERWVWRNRPILIPGGGLQSELPKELADATRDEALPVLRFDALAELDRGLVDRGRIGGRIPRMVGGSPVVSPRLFVDDRDAVSHADYLRFGCTLSSRYAGILRRPSVIARGKDHADAEKHTLEPVRTMRRITAPFRGDRSLMKAPKVLAVLPLTRGLVHDQITDVSSDATPFLILLDEIWFREYGAGEHLNVEIVLETKEIGDGDESRPFRVGPLPDHYVAAARLFTDSTDDEQDNEDGKRHKLPVFGPFGHSLDRSGNEALANATAFVAYLPAGVQAHYAVYVRLRRVLHDLKDEVLTPGLPGGTYALYTQPDAIQLAQDNAKLVIKQDKSYMPQGLNLTPVIAATPSVKKQYRYLLLLGPVFHDFGRGSELLLPSHAVWLDPESSHVRWPNNNPIASGDYHGRVLELLLNGRYDAGEAPIEDKDNIKIRSLQDILRALFANDGNPEDAPAMIRRISGDFAVTVQP